MERVRSREGSRSVVRVNESARERILAVELPRESGRARCRKAEVEFRWGFRKLDNVSMDDAKVEAVDAV